MVLKSFNFKLYYTEGGQTLARQIITEAETSLETMENFLGTRLVEQIDVFLSEAPVLDENIVQQRNGNIFLDNSSIYLNYCGNSQALIRELKEKLATILINGMLYGNTVKERLKNSREINVPNWYVSGLAKYVAGGNDPNTSWMADYFEGKLKLNLNMANNNELAKFGHAVFIHIHDSFGINKLRQLLFYTKLSGKTDYAFQYVLNKSLNWVIADWFRLERNKYLKTSNERLPNDPEAISEKLKTADIIEIKFSTEGISFELLIKTLDGVELWNYDLSTQKTKKIFRLASINRQAVWSFVNQNGIYYVGESNGITSKLRRIKNGKIEKTLNLEFSYILALKLHPIDGLAILAQKKYNTDVFQLSLNEFASLYNLTDNKLEETDFAFDLFGNLYITICDTIGFSILDNTRLKSIFKSVNPILYLNIYKNNYLSFIQTANNKNVGLVVNPSDSSQVYQVTNYTRSIINYNYDPIYKKVMEVLRYGNINYIVISDASFDMISPENVDLRINTLSEIKIADTLANLNSEYKLITGFEYKLKKLTKPEPPLIKDYKAQLRIKELAAHKFEFKPNAIRLGFSNSQFNSPLFAGFFPIRAGINNGPNILVGYKIADIYKKYSINASYRQPLRGKGIDLDFSIKTNAEKISYGFLIFNSNYEPELYNSEYRYISKEIKLFLTAKWHPRLSSISQIGYREDAQWPLAIRSDNLAMNLLKLKQPFFQTSIHYQIFNRSKLNYYQKLLAVFNFNFYKPFSKSGINSNLFFNVKHDQSFFRIFQLKTHISIQSSVGKQKTVWLLGGVSNWLKPVFANATIYNSDKLNMYSTLPDFPGLPYNYKAGHSAFMAKINLAVPLNPLLSQQNFNQNFFKFLTLQSSVNSGMAWFSSNPFSINNPDNKEIIETGSMTIINYSAKNPMVWSWGVGANSVLFGYEVGFEYATGFNEIGRIGKFSYLTIGKEF